MRIPRLLPAIGSFVPLLVLVLALLAGGARGAAAQALCDPEGNCDFTAPGVSVYPATGTHVTSSSASVGASACDNFSVAWVDLYVNGAYVASGYDDGYGCADVSYAAALQSGANTVSATACDYSYNCRSSSATVYYDPPPQYTYGVSVSPASGSLGTYAPSSTGGATFSVTNTSNTTSTISYSSSCSGAATCSPGSGSFTLGAGVSTSVTVSFSTTAAGNGPGTISFSAQNTEAGGGSAGGSQSLTVSAPYTYGVSVSPSSGSLGTYPPNSPGSAPFTIANTSNTTSTISYSWSCGGGSASCTAGSGSATLAAGAATTVAVSFTATSVGTGIVYLSARNTEPGGAATSGQQSFTVAVPVTVTVTANTPSMEATLGVPASVGFTVRNSSASGSSATFSVSAACPAGWGCSVSPTSVALLPAESYVFWVSFTPQAKGPYTITLNVSGAASGAASTAVTVPSPYRAKVSAQAAPTVYPGTRVAQAFTLANAGSITTDYKLEARCEATLQCLVQPDLQLIGGSQAPVSVSFTAPAAAGQSFTVGLVARTTQDAAVADSAFQTLTVSNPVTVPAPEFGPDGPLQPVNPGSTNTYYFPIRNPGTQTEQYRYQVVACPLPLGSCGVSPDSQNVAPGYGPAVSVTFSVPQGVSGYLGRIKVLASVIRNGQVAASDTGWGDVSSSAGAPAPASVRITNKPASGRLGVNVGATSTLVTEVKATDGSVITPALTWNSRNGDAVSVNTAGVVTGVAMGTAWIVVNVQANPALKDSVEVIAGAVPASITLTPLGTLSVQQAATLTATVKDAQGNPLPSESVAFTTANSGVISFENRQPLSVSVRGIAQGTATITATSTDARSPGVTASVSVTVSGGGGGGGGGGGTPVATSIRIQPPASTVLELNVGSVSVGATVYDQFGNPMAGQSITWSSRFSGVAAPAPTTGSPVTVKAGTAPGYTAIYATSGTLTDSVTFRVLRRRAAPLVTLAPDHPDSLMRDVARCVADCFESVHTYSTPAYVSLDQPRSLTLMQRSGYRNARARLSLDIDPQSFQRPTYIRLALKQANGSPVSFPQAYELVFAADTGLTRLAATFTTYGLPEGLNRLTAVVTAKWSDTMTVSEFTVPVLVMNSPAGSAWRNGWFVAGIPEMVSVAGGYMAHDGYGSVSFFRGTCATVPCNYEAPPGDPSTLTRTSTDLIRKYPDGTTVTVPITGTVRSVCDRFGNCTKYQMTPLGVTSVVDPANFRININYASDETFGDYPAAIYTPELNYGGYSRATSLYWTDSYLSINDQHGERIYWQSGNIVSRFVDVNGAGWTYNFNLSTLDLLSVTAPAVTLETGYAAPVARMLSPNGQIANRFSYSSGISEVNPIPAGLDRRAALIGPRADTTFITVNRFGSATRVEGPLSAPAVAVLDAWTGRPLKTVAANGATTVFGWKGTTALLDSIADLSTGAVQRFEYEGPFNQVKRVTGSGPEVVYVYDTTAGRPLKSVSVGGATTKYTTDSKGRVLTVTDPAGHVTRMAYLTQKSLNIDSVTSPGARRTKFYYDQYGREVKRDAGAGRVDSVAYTTGNLVQAEVQIDPATLVKRATERTYVSGPALATVRDAKGQQYSFGENVLGWRERQDDVLNRRELFAYDSSGNVRKWTSRMGETIRSSYDKLDRVVADSAPSGELRRFAYDSAGRWMTARNADAVDTLFFRLSGDLERAVTIRGGHRFEVFSRYTDPRFPRTRTGASLDGVDTQVDWTRNLNASGLTSTMYGSALAGISSFTYTQDMIPDSIKFGMGATRRRKILNGHTTGKLTFTPPGLGALLNEEYGYDSTARIVRRRTIGTDTATRNVFDAFGMLQEQRTVTAGSCRLEEEAGLVCAPDNVLAQTTYQFDVVGNPVLDAMMYYNMLQRLGAYAYDYDANGRMKRKYRVADSLQFNQRFEWNVLDQLTRVQTTRRGSGVTEGTFEGLTTVEFRYDAFGRRIRKSVWRDGVPQGSTEFIWDGDEVMAEVDGSSWKLRRQITSFGPDRPVGIRTPGTAAYNDTLFLLWPDEAGNIRGVTIGRDTASMMLVAAGDYTPFGATRPLRGAAGLPSPAVRVGRGFKGAAYDPETGLSYMRARFYDPDAQRFISEDPIGLDGGINPYTFAGNDPINGADPSGLDRCSQEYFEQGFHTEVIDGHEWCTRNSPLPAVEVTAEAPGGAPRSPRGGNIPTGTLSGGSSAGGSVGQTAIKILTHPCTQAIGWFVVNAAGDWMTFGAGKATVLGLREFQRQTVLAEMFVKGARREVAHRSLARMSLMGVQRDVALGLAGMAEDLPGTLMAGPLSDYLDLVPGFATGRSLVNAVNACSN